MAYCDKCGAYIPDGQKKCLACGFDSEEEAAKAAQAAQAEAARTAAEDTGKYYSFTNEELRRKLDEQRKKQQEQSRRWAEQEKQRRERERESGQWQSYTDAAASGAEASARSSAVYNASKTSNTKLLSILSYFSALFLIPMLFKPEDRTANFHAKQGLRLFIYGLICDAITWAPVIGALVQLSRLYLLVKGIMNAANGREEPLPYIGTIGDKK